MNQWNKPPLGSQIDFSHPLAKGLALCLLMNEGSGNKIYDLSGNGNHGVLMTNGPLWKPGRDGAALAFDGVNDQVECGISASFAANSPKTFILWINTSVTTAYNGLFWISYGYGFSMIDATNILLILSHNNYKYFLGRATCSDGQWHQLAITLTGLAQSDIASAKFYIDSKVQADGFINASAPIYAFDRYWFGRGYGAYFTGSMSQTMIYNRALSADEILDLYVNPYGFIRDPHKYWLMPQNVMIPPHILHRRAA